MGRKVNAGAYINVSNQSDYSAEEQKQKLKTWASENGADIYDFYIDNGTPSTPLSSRKEFSRLVSDVKSHKIDSVLTVDYERLVSDKDSLKGIINDFKEEGVDVYSVGDVVRGQ